MTKSFEDLGLATPITTALREKGYDKPTPIQQRAIPFIIEGHDVIAAAQTGTGKTAAFTLPLMHRLSNSERSSKRKSVRALILTPTRELAAQIESNIELYGKHLEINQAVVFGGVRSNPQIAKLKAGVDILIATPGRLLDLCSTGHCDLSEVEVLVMDEADRMLDMGFINDMRKVVKLLPRKRQNLLFSATFSKEIRVLTKEFLNDPISVEVASKSAAAQTVKQRAFRCDAKSKAKLAIKLISDGEWEQVLIFTRTKHGADRLTRNLKADGIKSLAIHGDKSQNARVKALEDFKQRKIRVLVATDIAARGIDISQLPHVVNFEIPNVSEDYVHRIGRTGRAEHKGEAVSLVSNEERAFFRDIEKLIKQKITLEDIEGFLPEDWPQKVPTANEVQKLRDERRKASFAARGPKQSNQGNRANSKRKNSKPASAKRGQGSESHRERSPQAPKEGSRRRRSRGKK